MKRKMTKKMPFKKLDMTIFTFVILCITALILAANIVLLFFSSKDSTKSILVFNILESILMFALIFVPTMIDKIIRFKIPASLEVMYIAFCSGSIIYGEILDFYGKIGWWDSLLHSFSGVLLGVLGYSIINTFNKYSNESKEIRFSPLFVSIWCVCFALAVGVLWELIEFTCDEFLGTNMQQYLVGRGTLDKGDALVGHEALRDTMKDLALDLIGSLIPAVVGFFELKKNKDGFANSVLEKDVKNKKEILVEELEEKDVDDTKDGIDEKKR